MDHPLTCHLLHCLRVVYMYYMHAPGGGCLYTNIANNFQNTCCALVLGLHNPLKVSNVKLHCCLEPVKGSQIKNYQQKILYRQ